MPVRFCECGACNTHAEYRYKDMQIDALRTRCFCLEHAKTNRDKAIPIEVIPGSEHTLEEIGVHP